MMTVEQQKIVLGYIKLVNQQIRETSDNDLLIDLLDEVDDTCDIQLRILEDAEDDF